MSIVMHQQRQPERAALIRHTMRKGLNSNTMKYIAAAAMLLDHIAWAFLPLSSVWAQLLHCIGRISAPLFCFCLTESYFNTRNRKKFLRRVGIFAAISHFPYVLFQMGTPPTGLTDVRLWEQTSILFTFLIAILLLNVVNWPYRTWKQIFLLALLCVCSFWGDSHFYGVLWVLGFAKFRGNVRWRTLWYYLIVLLSLMPLLRTTGKDPSALLPQAYQLGLLVPPLLFGTYSGRRGSKKPLHKWFFYVFYPAHLLLLALLQFWL